MQNRNRSQSLSQIWELWGLGHPWGEWVSETKLELEGKEALRMGLELK